MLIGVLAIYGAAIPFVIGFSGHYSKDSIIAQALSFWDLNPRHGAILAGLAIAGSGITAFYMFRMWFMTFAGKPRDHHVYEHVHESPPVMYVPLVVLSVFAFAAGFPFLPFSVPKLLEQARYPGAAATAPLLDKVVFPEEFLSHSGVFHSQAEIIITFVALGGLALAVAFYGLQLLSAEEAKKQFAPIYKLLWNKYYFDEIYAAIFIRPVMFVSKLIANFDRWFIDGIIHRLAAGVRQITLLDDMIDRYFVDGLVNLVAAWTWSIGNSLRSLQTGRLRQYVMLIVIGTVALTLLVRWSVAAGN
jgi:NADH-quinone oxidoreductase subunit L